MEEKHEFSTNAFLTLVTDKLFTDIGILDDHYHILKEAMDIISYMCEDLESIDIKDMDINKTCKNFLIGHVDPIIIEIANETNSNNYSRNKVILNKFLGPKVSIGKIQPSHINKIKEHKQKIKV